MKRKELYVSLDLGLFAVTQTTGLGTLTAEMKTFYDKNLIRNAEPELVHDQFAQTRNIPKNGGKKIEFRKYDALPAALTPLTEGVTPAGSSLKVTTVEAEVKQYGDFVQLSDLLILTAIDNNIVEATELLGSQAGRTLDNISRDYMVAGTNVIYGNGSVTSRESITEDMKLTVDLVKKAVRALKVQNAKPINGYYWGIIHPDCSYDLTSDEHFIEAVKYKNPERIYRGEIGEIQGVRFVETTEAKVFSKAGSGSIDVYAVLIGGANAYATTTVEGGALETIIKQIGSAGTSDPLNQRATVGWKALKVTEILSNQYMVRVEVASTFGKASEAA